MGDPDNRIFRVGMDDGIVLREDLRGGSMTAKEFLSQAWQIDQRIERKIEERDRIEEKLTSGRISNLSGMPRGGGYDWTDTAAKVADLTSQIDVEIRELCRIKRIVNEAIDAVESAKYRRVLELRYRNYLDWEKIAEELGYELRWVYELHGRALLRVKVPGEFA